MKKILFIILSVVLVNITFAQIGGTVRDSLTATTLSKVHHFIGGNYDYIRITITLSEASDTVFVYSGTNYPDIPYASNDFVRVGVKNMLTYADAQLITGSATKLGYLVLYAPRAKNIKLETTAAPGGASRKIIYTMEAY